MWAAYYQFDGDIRFTVATKKFRGAVEQILVDFVARMTHPEVGLWWVWIEEVADGGRETTDACALSEVRGREET